jgi:catechol 2,3-dioxygenase-like lactoylglutathione lyase family enzyme
LRPSLCRAILIGALCLSLLQPALPLAAEPSVLGRSTGSFFALSVADVDAASRWYQDKLGFHVVSHGEAPDKVAKFAILEGDGTIVEMIQHRDARPLAVAAPSVKAAHQLHGIFKAGVVVENLDGVYRRIKERGVPIAYDLMPAKDVPLRSFSIRDGEGNLIQFFGK